jgi:hypothetical protein
MDDAKAETAKARRAILLLYVLMAAGILLPLAYWWFRR